MKQTKTSKRDGVFPGVLVVLLLIASLALNVMLLTGCLTINGGGKGGKKEGGNDSRKPTESTYLRGIAAQLGIDESSDKTPGDIAFDIEQRLSARQVYRGTVLSEETVQKVSSAIWIPADRETFESYHEFIGKVAGKTILVID